MYIIMYMYIILYMYYNYMSILSYFSYTPAKRTIQSSVYLLENGEGTEHIEVLAGGRNGHGGPRGRAFWLVLILAVLCGIERAHNQLK